jgi:hypothetical protein
MEHKSAIVDRDGSHDAHNMAWKGHQIVTNGWYVEYNMLYEHVGVELSWVTFVSA